MKKSTIYKFLAMLFSAITIAGGIYVFMSSGRVNAGYACVPMLFTLVFTSAYRREEEQEKRNRK